MFEDYRKAVFQDYHEKKAANLLHGDLAYPTPVKLQKECLRACESRFLGKDAKTLGSNFGQQPDAVSFSSAIRNIDSDKLKPLATWLKGKTSTRDENKVELLAWLTDFEPRPYQHYLKYITEAQSLRANTTIENIATPAKETLSWQMESQQQPAAINADHGSAAEAQPLPGNTTIENIAALSKDTIPGQIEIRQQPAAINWKKWISWPAALVIASISIYFITRPSGLIGNERCMYWAGDHYQPAACNEKKEVLVALDPQKTAHFKRIGRNELNHESLGKVWYVRIDSTIEFYTDSGFHPTHPQKRLLPLTVYILNKYIYNIADRHKIPPGQAIKGAGARYIEVFLNINASDKVLVNGVAATADEMSEKPNTLKLVRGKRYIIKINNCPEQEITPTKNTTLSVCM